MDQNLGATQRFASRIISKALSSFSTLWSNAGPRLKFALAAILSRPTVIWAACVMLVFSIYTPGYMSGDSLSYYNAAGNLDRLVIYHPPFLTFLFAIGRAFADDQSVILLMQLCCYFGGLWFLLHSITEKKHLVSIGLLLLGLFPSTFPIIGVLWKSVWMTSFLLFALGFALQFFRTPKIGFAIGTLVFIFLSMLTRFDAIAPAGVILFMLALRLIVGDFNTQPRLNIFRWTRSALLALLAGLASLIPMATLVGYTNNEITVDSRYPSHVFLYQDLLSISINSNEIYLPQYVKDANPEISIETLRQAYDPTTCNAFLQVMNQAPEDQIYRLKRPADAEEAQQFADAWRQAVSNEPLAYLQGRLGIWQSLYGFRDDVHYPYHAGISKNTLGITLEMTPVKSAARAVAEFWARDVKLLHRPWLMITAGIVAILLTLFSASIRFMSPSVFLMVMAGTSHFFTLSLISCAGDFRFAFFLVTMTVLTVFMVVTAYSRTSSLKV